ncbi:hypothetical protein Ciccas_010093 [Cichlidogyrus casuarinus]|uniref:EF-hand domain-containing protein n=1 Tax=Cichlidogyrus casuarinus TaxID=1844966 RepID=A0ABD2PW71_9PLAT
MSKKSKVKNKKTNLNDEQLGEFRAAFEASKLDEKSRLAPEHVILLLRKIGLTPSSEDVEKIFEEVDKEGRMYIEGLSFNDFCEFASRKVADVHTPADVIEAFANFDPQKSGFINAESLAEYMTHINNGTVGSVHSSSLSE